MTDATLAAPPEETPLHVVVPASTLRTVVDVLGALVEECRMRFDADGVHVAAMDPATVASVSLDLSPAAFESYDVEERTLGVPLERLDDVLSMASGDDPVQLALDPETRRLTVAVAGLDYTMALVDPEAIRSPPDLAEMEFEYTAAVTLESTALSRSVRAADMVSSHATVGVDADDEAFVVSASGDTDDVRHRLAGDDLLDIDAGEAESLFSVDYLTALERPIPSGSEVTLELGMEIPMALSFEIAAGAGQVEYALSPRIAR
ncbi:DNA polymerase sliding clamp [Halomarina oriensis]|uniref:DNA polymerase sliding clamp n=1 Tax=Halomarina oriensis TaxID=671145 RepID=A0A6B0GQF5_9EURY|nr:DNA polymerase sliding clamp [Halomarina oriensis]MWG35819.1 DNA polymerase sliding clamp [Halomarina oriensis]